MSKFTSSDTSPEAEKFMTELLRQAPPWKKAAMVFGLGQVSRALIMAELHARYPDADSTELHKRYAARVLTRNDVINAYGWDPEVEGY